MNKVTTNTPQEELDDFEFQKACVLDLLYQIKEVNKMISLHKEGSRDSLMVSQYEYLRSNFLTDLKEILAEFGIEITTNA